MLSSRNPATRASNIYRERYTKELKTSANWQGTFGLVDPSVLSPTRSPQRPYGATLSGQTSPDSYSPRARATEGTLSSPQPRTGVETLPPLGAGAVRGGRAAGCDDASPSQSLSSTMSSGSASPARLLSSTLASTRSPQPPQSPVRTSRRNYRHLSPSEARAFYDSYVARPQSEYARAVSESIASLPKV